MPRISPRSSEGGCRTREREGEEERRKAGREEGRERGRKRKRGEGGREGGREERGEEGERKGGWGRREREMISTLNPDCQTQQKETTIPAKEIEW